jgi:hypothetical protein
VGCGLFVPGRDGIVRATPGVGAGFGGLGQMLVWYGVVGSDDKLIFLLSPLPLFTRQGDVSCCDNVTVL